jgi:methionyl-tRNA formyltransferase
VDAHRIERFRGAEINAPQTVNRIRELEPDLIAIAAFSRILKTEVINLPARACINAHPSLLPKYRGPVPYRWVLRYGENTTGVTIHHVTPQIDAGDIILQREIPIARDETERSLIEKTLPVAAASLVKAIGLIAEETARRVPQDELAASYFTYHGPRTGNNNR